MLWVAASGIKGPIQDPSLSGPDLPLWFLDLEIFRMAGKTTPRKLFVVLFFCFFGGEESPLDELNGKKFRGLRWAGGAWHQFSESKAMGLVEKWVTFVSEPCALSGA